MTARNSRDPDGAWHGISVDHYRTRGAEVLHRAGMGWFAHAGNRVRGPLSCLDAAMAAAERMINEAKPADSLNHQVAA